jgi:hypothetical protein
MGTISSAIMANLYKLTCFEKYPHFHVKAQSDTEKTLINNALHSHSHERGWGRRPGYEHDKDKGHQKGKGDRHGKGKSKGWGRSQSQGRHKGKGRGNPQKPGNADPKTKDGETSVITVASGRDCRKRKAEESNKSQKTTTNSSQKVTFADDDEVEALFNNALFAHDTDSDNASPDQEMIEEAASVSEDDIECETCDSDKEIDAQDKAKHIAHPAIQTQEEDTPPPTFASSNETDIMDTQQDANGDPVNDTIKQEDETIHATPDHLESCPTYHTLTQDKSSKVRQPKETEEKHSKRARKNTIQEPQSPQIFDS